MDKVLVDVEVINGILKAHNRADKNQTRVYGLIIGTQKDNLYHITDVIYGYIFESGENSTTHTKQYSRLSDETTKALLNSLHRKFDTLSQQKGGLSGISNKDKENNFKSVDNQMILGGFATDRELFNDLHNLYTTIELINNNMFKNINELILLVDPSYKDKKALRYGTKTFKWYMKTIKINNKEIKRLLEFKEIDNEIIEYINTVQIVNNKNNDKFFIDNKLYNIDLEKKDDQRNINEILEMNVEGGEDNKDNNISYIKNKVKQSLNYLNLIEKVLENKDEKDMDNNDYNQLALMLSKLEPILSNEEILDEINNNVDKVDIINSLTQLLKVQLNLSNKINQIVE